jgi:hypothetical protein
VAAGLIIPVELARLSFKNRTYEDDLDLRALSIGPEDMRSTSSTGGIVKKLKRRWESTQ